MTVELQVPITIAAVTVDGQAVFNFAFQANDIGDLYATYVAIDGTRTEFVGGVDFTATGLGNPNGGAITLTSFTGTEDGQNFVIYREIAIERENDYSRDLLSDELNREQNRIFQILQDLNRRIDNSLQVAPGETPADISAIFAAAAAAAASASDASDSADAAAGHASAARGSARAAAGFVTLSQEWAMNPEDDDVTPGNYSSYHWSRKSRLWAVQAQGVPVSGGEFSAYHWAKKAEATVTSGVANGSVTIPKLAPDVVALINANVKYLGAGAALPGADKGPIFHADYGGILVWQVFNANGAAYAGYASVEIGMVNLDGRSTARPGWLKRNGATLLKASYPALWNMAQHLGLVVSLGSWTDGAHVFAEVDANNFKLPNTRGRHGREWSDGFSLDSGRGFGTSQSDQNKAHSHGITDPGHTHPFTGIGAVMATGVAGARRIQTPMDNTGTVAFNVPASTTGITIGSDGGTETRVVNTAYLGVIKF